MADIPPTSESYQAKDGYSLQYRHWTPCDAPRARVVCIHGIQSHGGWYVHSSSRLCEAGFEVFFLDRRGSGRNLEKRGHVSNFHVLLDDLALFLSRVRVLEPRRPILLSGVSWGGKLGVALAKDHPQMFDGLALLCPGLFPRVGVSFATKLRVAMARVYAKYRHFTIPLSDPELFTATPHWLDFLRRDPDSLHRATASMLVASTRLDWYLRDAPEKILMPTLLMIAGQDRIIDNDRLRTYFARFASPQKTLKEYPQAHHTLEFEPDPEPFISDLVQWMVATTDHIDSLRALRTPGIVGPTAQ